MNIVDRVNRRIAYWHEQGFHGPETYLKLATDTELPAEIEEDDAGQLAGIEKNGMKSRRSRNQPPPYLKKGKYPVYPRYEFFTWIASQYRQPAAAE
ncbi:hypothetical protein [Ensifer sp.]|uniref:hypothetical protein n=1 Tax=Ensifer sp. TaxID=1872086 RepID=UPI00289C38FC|nr:hypothetical protein [Ensifer sp.]